jgi:CRP/FNR family transcriptional regulator/CRP/FNR family cyclic AMP-dependent transcriptional regulator
MSETLEPGGPAPGDGPRAAPGTDDPAAIARHALQYSALFHALDDECLARTMARLTRRRFRRGEVIFHRDDPGDAMHVVASGLVTIRLASADGEDAILGLVGPGSAFGEIALMDGQARSATATAHEPTTTYTLTREAFADLMMEPTFRAAVLRGIARGLRRATVHVAELHFLDLPGRLASVLVRMVDERPASSAEPLRVRRFRQTELASMVGATRESVSRYLAELAAVGLIRIEPDGIVIPDLAALERRAAW